MFYDLSTKLLSNSAGNVPSRTLLLYSHEARSVDTIGGFCLSLTIWVMSSQASLSLYSRSVGAAKVSVLWTYSSDSGSHLEFNLTGDTKANEITYSNKGNEAMSVTCIALCLVVGLFGLHHI